MAVAQEVSQNRNLAGPGETCRKAKSARMRAGGVPWAAAAPGSANITCSGVGWQISKSVKLKKKDNTKDPTEKQPPLD